MTCGLYFICIFSVLKLTLDYFYTYLRHASIHRHSGLLSNPLTNTSCFREMCILLLVGKWLLEVAGSHKVKLVTKKYTLVYGVCVCIGVWS